MTQFGGITGEQLRQMVSKIEKLEAEKKETIEFINDAYSEAKGLGFDTKALKTLIKIRAQDAQKLAEFEEILDLYKNALGMVEETE